MRRIPIFLPLFLLLCCGPVLPAAPVVIKDFRCMHEAFYPVDAPVYDPDGRRCALIRFCAPCDGWTFEAGTWGVMDVTANGNTYDVYVPAEARSISVSHPTLGRRLDWPFPEPLAEGMAYVAVLEKGKDPVAPRPRPVPAPAPAATQYRPKVQAPAPAPAAQSRSRDSWLYDSEKHFPTEFLDFYMGFLGGEGACGGFRYTHVEERIGGYLGVGFTCDETFALVGGTAIRLREEEKSCFDIQWTLGIGISDSIVLETGLRFALKGACAISGWDFGLGLQYYDGVVVPTVEVGLLIWGIPVVCALGLCL